MGYYEKIKEVTEVRLGIAIVNDTTKDFPVRFLGMRDAKRPEGISVINMYADIFYDDNKLSQLRDWIISVGRIEIAVTRFQSLNTKQVTNSITLIQPNNRGEENYMSIHTAQYMSANQFNAGIIDVPVIILIDCWTEFEYVVQKFTSCTITFFPSRKQKEKLHGFDKLYDDLKYEYKEYSAEAKKKFLFLK